MSLFTKVVTKINDFNDDRKFLLVNFSPNID